MKLIFFSLTFLFILACSPWPYNYYSPQADEGALKHKGPSIIGPKNAITLNNSGFELEARFTGHLKLEIYIPEGAILLPSIDYLLVKNSNNDSKQYPVRYTKFGSSTYVNKLIGYKRENIIQKNGTNYYSEVKIEEVSDKFTIKLPSFKTESGKIIEFNDITFTNKNGLALMPIN